MRSALDPYLKVIRSFNQKKVRYVLIGVSAINYYAESASQIILTGDFDIFIEPEVSNVRKAVQVLRGQSFHLSAGDRMLTKGNLKAIEICVQGLQTIQAQNQEGNLLELCLNVSGFTFDQLNHDAVQFQAKKIKVRVPKLEKLLKMKECAGRPKDKLFLQRYHLFQDE